MHAVVADTQVDMSAHLDQAFLPMGNSYFIHTGSGVEAIVVGFTLLLRTGIGVNMS